MITKIISKDKEIHDFGLATQCDKNCKHSKDLFFGKIYCKKYGWILKGINCKNYKPRR